MRVDQEKRSVEQSSTDITIVALRYERTMMRAQRRISSHFFLTKSQNRSSRCSWSTRGPTKYYPSCVVGVTTHKIDLKLCLLTGRGVGQDRSCGLSSSTSVDRDALMQERAGTLSLPFFGSDTKAGAYDTASQQEG